MTSFYYTQSVFLISTCHRSIKWRRIQSCRKERGKTLFLFLIEIFSLAMFLRSIERVTASNISRFPRLVSIAWLNLVKHFLSQRASDDGEEEKDRLFPEANHILKFHEECLVCGDELKDRKRRVWKGKTVENASRSSTVKYCHRPQQHGMSYEVIYALLWVSVELLMGMNGVLGVGWDRFWSLWKEA